MTVVEQIINGDLDGELDSIKEALRQRRKLKSSQKTAMAMITINVGDIVVLKNLTPKYVNGERAKVVKKNRTKFQVKLDKPVGRFGTLVTVPASCLDRV